MVLMCRLPLLGSVILDKELLRFAHSGSYDAGASVLHELNSFSLFAFHGIFHQTKVRQLDMVENT